MSGFVTIAGGGAEGHFRAGEASILADLVTQLIDFVEHRGGRESDPAVQRLFPDAYRDSSEDAAEFRRFTEDDLADRKVRNANAVLQSLDVQPHNEKSVVLLDVHAVQAWLRTLTDLRLTLAARLSISADGTIPIDADEMAETLYEWLGYLQESLVAAIDV